ATTGSGGAIARAGAAGITPPPTPGGSTPPPTPGGSTPPPTPGGSQPELLQAARALRPAGLDLDEQLEEDAPAEQALELEARAAADPPQPGPARPDDDALVVLSCDQDRRADDDDVALRVLGEALHLDRRAVRDLLLGLEEELFADRFLDEEAL